MALHRTILAAAAAALVMAGIATPERATAQTCGGDYVIQEGDSLGRIARAVYGDASNWTVIFYANQDRLGASNSLIVPGQSIRIPCLSGTQALPQEATVEAAPSAPAPILTSRSVRKVEFLTADEYVPFTDRSLPGGGMLTELLSRAMERINEDAEGTIDVNISWVNDWSAHLQPLLVTRAFDMGFPWYQPPCADFDTLDDDSKFRCRRFFFSDPLFEPITALFVRRDSPMQFRTDSEVHGKTLCRPAGYFVFDLNANGRNWLTEGRVTLLRPQSVQECFRLLSDGAIDAVVINEFTGRATMTSMGLSEQVRMIEERPVSIAGLRVVVAKTHPQARTLIHYVNSAIRQLREDGDYDAIVERHLTRYWDTLEEEERARRAATAAASTGDQDNSVAQ